MKLFNIIFFISLSLISSTTFALNIQFLSVEKEIKSIEKNISAQIGVTVLNVKTGDTWNYKGDEIFPLTSTFKTIACAQ